MSSRDIRCFFKPKSKNSTSHQSKDEVIETASAKHKKPEEYLDKIVSVSSDSNSDTDDSYASCRKSKEPKKEINIKRKNDIIHGTPNKPIKILKKSRSKPENDVSGENIAEKLRPIGVGELFNKTVKQSQMEEQTKILSDMNKKNEGTLRKLQTEFNIHKDNDFEKTLVDLDDDIFLQNEDKLDEKIEEALWKTSEDEHFKSQSSNSKKRNLPDDSTVDTSNKKTKLKHFDSGFDGQEHFEKKKYCAMLYQKYLNRSGPKNYGRKKLPKGKADCLANLCFMRTGVLDSLQPEEFEDLITKHGGKVAHSVTKKINYVVVGDDPGPAKYEKAKKYGIPFIDEDQLLDLILQKSDMPKKYTAKEVDDGIYDSFKSSESEETPSTSQEKYFSSTLNKDEKSSEQQDDLTTFKVNQKDPLQKFESIDEDNGTNTEKNKETNVGITEVHLSLTEKYKPKELKDIIGQQTANSNMNKLKKWLEYWNQSEILRKQKKIPQPRPWDKNNDGSFYKCALLSGPPGVGKTTTATLVAKTLGFDIVEFNASDTRSKKLLQEEVKSALHTKTISSFNIINGGGLDSKRVILMDEVDGMAGNADRGGMQELLLLIKGSRIPIICMCNDRNNTKIRSLANYCFDLRFEKPKPQQILGFLMSICCKEGINMTPKVASEIIGGTTCDIRQTLNQVTVLSNVNCDISLEQAKKDSSSSKKDTILGPWQVCKMVFDETDQKDMSLIEKSRLFFYDYSLGPLFVQENYLKVQPNNERNQILKNMASAADAISIGATIDKKIRETNNWALLDLQAIYSSVLPGHYVCGRFINSLDFPRWLGKNSMRTKFMRLNKELVMHSRIRISGGSSAMNLDYGRALLGLIVTPLKKKGSNGVSEAVDAMKSYQLLREDLDSLEELYSWPKLSNILSGIDSKVKAALTRTYKKEVPAFPYSNIKSSKKKTVSIADEEFNDDDQEDASETDEKIENDSLVKLKQRKKKNENIDKPSKLKKGKSGSKTKN